MNTQEEFQIRLDSYEFILDECIGYENKIQDLSASLEEELEHGNIGTAKRLSLRGFNHCKTLETLYYKFTYECSSFRDFLSFQKDEEMKQCLVLVSEQIQESQKNIEGALIEHKKLFQEIIKY